MSRLFVAYYESTDFSKDKPLSKLVLTRAHKGLRVKYREFIACEDAGTGSVEYLIDGGIVSTSSGLDGTYDITLIHSSKEGLEQLARKLALPFPLLGELPRLNFDYSAHPDERPSCLDIHRRDKK